MTADVLIPIRVGKDTARFFLKTEYANDYWFDFTVSEVDGLDDSSEVVPLAPYISGSLKFDGSMHLYLSQGFVYFGTHQDIGNFHRMLEAVWAEGQRNLKNWCGR